MCDFDQFLEHLPLWISRLNLEGIQSNNTMFWAKPDYLRQDPAWFHTRILVGPGAFLTPTFAHEYRITHVINCAFPGDSPEWFQKLNPDKYVCLEAIDSPFMNILSWYPKFEEAMWKFLRRGNGVVYVHCQAGMNRSGSLALAYVCKNFSIKVEDIVPVLKRQRPCLFGNTVYMNQVKDFINGRVQSEEDS